MLIHKTFKDDQRLALDHFKITKNNHGKKKIGFKKLSFTQLWLVWKLCLHLPIGWRVGEGDTAQVGVGTLSDVTSRTHQHTCVLWRVYTDTERLEQLSDLLDSC